MQKLAGQEFKPDYVCVLWDHTHTHDKNMTYRHMNIRTFILTVLSCRYCWCTTVMSLKDSWNLKIPCHTLTMTQLRLSSKYVWHHEKQAHTRLFIWPGRNVLNNSGCVLQPQWKMSVHFCFFPMYQKVTTCFLVVLSDIKHKIIHLPRREAHQDAD